MLPKRPFPESALVGRGEIESSTPVSSKWIHGISAGTCTPPTASAMPATASRANRITVKWSWTKPTSASSETYSARCRAVSCGSARKTGPIS